MAIQIFDTTLRDGAQSEGISFTVEEKINIALLLDEIGIDYIEAGWPGSNPKDIDFFHLIKKRKINHAKITAFGSTRHHKFSCQDDPNLQAILEAQPDAACIFGKSWDLHVKKSLNIALKENIDLIAESVAFLKERLNEVIFDAEHFFDGYKNNPEYAVKTLQAADEAGADNITLCDTNGGAMPWEIEKIIKDIRPQIQCKLGIHTHNDSEFGVANALIAVNNGATLVQGTINGLGERCGNCNLISIIANLNLKMDKKCLKKGATEKLSYVSQKVCEYAQIDAWRNQPFTGKSAFAHKGGIHVSAILKDRNTYEHIKPESVGNKTRVLLSDLSGKSNIDFKSKELGISDDTSPNVKRKIVEKIKKLENEGYAFEDADASVKLLVLKEQELFQEYFSLCGYRVIDERRQHDENPITEASIIIKDQKDKEYHTVSLGNGPIDALSQSLKKALNKSYPILDQVQLVDYRVRILNADQGTAATTRVSIVLSDKKEKWTTVGVHQNVIRASYIALTDSFLYYLNINKKN